MTDILTFDIETIPQPRFWDQAYEPAEWWWEKHLKDEDLSQSMKPPDYPFADTGQLPACHPATCFVASASFGWNDGPEFKTQHYHAGEHLRELRDAEEVWPEGDLAEAERQTLLRIARALVKGVRSKTLVTFNGKSFDVPIIRWRCAAHRIPLKLDWYDMLYRYKHSAHCDLRLLFSDGDSRAKGTLELWSSMFGIGSESGGSKVLGWFRSGLWAEFTRYGDQEMRTLFDMFQKAECVL